MLPISLPAARVRVLAAALTAAAASVVFAGTFSPAHAAGRGAPTASVPSVSGGAGFALGYLPCGGNTR